MDRERWRRIELIYNAALDRDLRQRSSFLSEACLDDEELRREIESLLEQGSEVPGPLERPPWDVLANLLARAQQRALPAGARLGSYVVKSFIGAGGMGVVYQAEDVKLNRQVALKLLPEGLPEHNQAVERLWREARAASALNHPNIATVHAVEEWEGRTFIVMELLEGQSLKQIISDKPVVLASLLELAVQIADGLEAAHSRGIIHRDIKPANLFATSRGQLKILDFGVAKFQAAEPSASEMQPADTVTDESSVLQTLTSTGALIGTVAYMSPEQVSGLKLDTRTDLFSLGAVLYEMATGVAPFRGETAAFVRDSILKQPPVPPARLNPRVPVQLDRVITKALEKNREQRYQSAAELRSALQAVQNVSAARAKRRSRLWISAAVLLAIALAAAAFLFWERRRPPAVSTEPLPIQLTANGPDSRLNSAAISPDGKYLAYSDPDGVSVRTTQGIQGRLVPNTKGMTIEHWSADGSKIFLSDARGNYSVSLPDGQPHSLGDILPFPDGRHVFRSTKQGAVEVRDANGKVSFSLPPYDGMTYVAAMAPGTNFVAVVFARQSGSAWIDAFEIDSGRRTTLLPPQPVMIDALTWLSGNTLLYSLAEGTDWAFDRPDNLWLLAINPSSGRPAKRPIRRSHWADLQINRLTATADGKRVCFLRSKFQQNIWIGTLKAKGFELAGQRRLTQGNSIDWPWTWTPDSKALVFTSDRARPGYGIGEIYKQNIEEKGVEPLTPGVGSSFAVRLSPDGRWLLYVRSQAIRNSSQLMRIPVTGGEPRQVLTSEGYIGHNCSSVTGGACVLVETDGKTTTVSLLDPVKGRGAHLFRDDEVHFVNLSPDGKHLAYLIPEKPQKRIRVTDLHGGIEQEIKVADANDLQNLDWLPDSSGFFTSDSRNSNETRLLHVGRDGVAQVLWTDPDLGGLNSPFAIPSPDGRYLATFKSTLENNAWMVENP